MGAWNVGTDRYCNMQTLALRDIYESNQNKQDFLLCLLFVICSKKYGKQIAIHLPSTKHQQSKPSPLPPPPALTTNCCKACQHEYGCLPKGVYLGNINSNIIFNFRLYQRSNDKSFYFYFYIIFFLFVL